MRAFLMQAPPIALFALLSIATTTLAAGAEDGVPSGLRIDVTRNATCSRPTRAGDMIQVHYKGFLLSTGVEFDESYKRGAPFMFQLGAGRVIKGWDQGLVDMCPEERRNLTISPELAYGESGNGPIPGHSTLVFETELVAIVGVKQESVSIVSSTSTAVTNTQTEEVFGIATAPPTPPPTTMTPEPPSPSPSPETDDADDKDELVATPLETPTAGSTSLSPEEAREQAECKLLGPFALLVQGALGAVAILSLVWKRYRETPKRPWKIFFFDVSKQVFGSMLTHVLNLAMSIMGSVTIVNGAQLAAAGQAQAQAAGDDGDPRMPNPCSFYLLNLGIDTTIGIPVLYLLLKVLHTAAAWTPLARPPQSIKSGNYGQPPKILWWLKQLLIYFIGLVGMKLFVLFLFSALPWLPWVGDWALRWTNGNEALEITFAMFIFPLAMNALQYWIIDSFIMDRQRGQPDGYQQVGDEEDDEGGEGEGPGARLHVDGTDVTFIADGEAAADRKDRMRAEEAALEDADPTPVPAYETSSSGASSDRNSPPAKEGGRRR